MTKDPEVLENDVEGDEKAYDGKAVKSIDYDHSQFKLPDDFVDDVDE